MTLPLLEYAPTSQNHRVDGFEVLGDEQPRVYSLEAASDESEVSEIIWAAYSQIFNEQHLLTSYRQTALESQLRHGQLTVKEFIRGLLNSDSFRRLNFEPNSNYRFAELCVQRVLGRNVYGEDEKIAWSIVIATQGVIGFIDELLASNEYLENFGEDTVPFQRRRTLPQHDRGEVSFAHFPRYGSDHLAQLKALGYFDPTPRFGQGELWQRLAATRPLRWSWQKPPYTKSYQLIAKVSGYGIAGGIALLIAIVALSAWGILPL